MNVITIELCAEDRARLDRLIAAMERKTCDKCVATVSEVLGQARVPASDPLQQKLADTLAKAGEPTEAPKNATHAPSGVPASPNTHPIDEELPWAESAPAPVPVKEIDLAEFQKALTLRCAESEEMKARVRALLHEYGPAASKVPADKRAEVLERLAKL